MYITCTWNSVYGNCSCRKAIDSPSSCSSEAPADACHLQVGVRGWCFRSPSGVCRTAATPSHRDWQCSTNLADCARFNEATHFERHEVISEHLFVLDIHLNHHQLQVKTRVIMTAMRLSYVINRVEPFSETPCSDSIIFARINRRDYLSLPRAC